ncbi:MAG: DUF547 domain-containing protein [Pseudomonadota bacterium]
MKLLPILLLATALLTSPAKAATIARPTVLPAVIQLDESTLAKADPVLVSARFVDQVIHDQAVQVYLDHFRQLDAATLDAALDSQARQLAFWINVYNGYTQHFLKTDPALYLRDRPAYFSKAQVGIVGDLVSLEDIEHGVLRRGATIYTLGHVRLLFLRSTFIQRFAVDSVDYRIHFALNCGARSCPAVLPYTTEQVDVQLDASTRDYLQREARYDAASNTVQVPALLRWFSADFEGGSADAKRGILRRHGVIPAGVEPDIDYRPYDWTLHIRNYALFTP